MHHAVIKLAISQRCFPGMSSEETAARATSIGFDGIAIDGASSGGGPVAAVYTGLGFTGVAAADDEAGGAIEKLVELAAGLNCAVVQLPDVAVAAKFKQSPSPLAIGDWLLTLADQAADHGVTLAVVNGSAVRTAKMMWNLLERANHPAIACCWDVDAALRWGESPGVSVPTLGSRIAAARISAIGASTEQLIVRLRGIGFGGWVMVDEPSIATEAGLASLRGWIRPKAVAAPKATKKTPPAKAGV